MVDRARFMSVSSTAVENRASFIPRNRSSPGNWEKKPTRVVAKPLSYCPRHILFVVGKALLCTLARHHARRYCRRHIRTISLCRHFSLTKFSIARSSPSLAMTPRWLSSTVVMLELEPKAAPKDFNPDFVTRGR